MIFRTAISVEEGTNNQDSAQEQILENIKLHKEVLQQVKWQPWSMKRKLRLVQQARSYIAKHEGELQERFAASRNTKDMFARFKMMIRTVRYFYFRLNFLLFYDSFIKNIVDVTKMAVNTS